MISRSDWEPLPKPTLSPFARGYLSLCRFFTAAVCVVCACSAGSGTVGSFSNKTTFAKSRIDVNYDTRPPLAYGNAHKCVDEAGGPLSTCVLRVLGRVHITGGKTRIANPRGK